MEPHLDAVLQECLEQDPEDWESAVEAACEEHPSLADGLRERLRSLRSFGLVPESGAAPASTAASPPGFALGEVLGGGAMGTVHAAERIRDGRPVALKFLHAHLQASPRARLRFEREVELASRISHPNLCAVLGSGIHAGVPYLVLERIEGATLASRIARRGGGAPSAGEVQEVADQIAQVASALAALHDVGLVHRDVKPVNIMRTAEGRAVLLDLGLAQDPGASRLTVTGESVGSPAYMAPEVVGGGEADARSDVYGLGVTLHEALTGRLPFSAPTREGLYRAVLQDSPPPLRRDCPSASPDLELVVATAMARDPARRYASAHDLARDLRAVAAGGRPQVRRAPWVSRLSGWVARNRAATGIGVALVAGLTVALWALQEARGALRHSRALTDAIAAPRAGQGVALDLAMSAVEAMVAPPTLGSLHEVVANHHRSRILAELPGEPTQLVLRAGGVAVRTRDAGEDRWAVFGPDGRASSDPPPPDDAPWHHGLRGVPTATSADGRVTAARVSGAPEHVRITVSGRATADVDLGLGVLATTVSADGTRVAVLCEDESFRILAGDGSIIGNVPFHGVQAHSFVFSPDGRLLACGDGDSVVRIYRDDGQQLYDLVGHTGFVAGVAFTPDGEHLVTTAEDRTLRRWEVHPVGVVEIRRNWVLRVDRTGDLLLSADSSGAVHVRRADADLPVQIHAAAGGLLDAVLIGDGEHVAVVGRDGAVEILGLAGARSVVPGIDDAYALAARDGIVAVGCRSGVRMLAERRGAWSTRWHHPTPAPVTAVAVSGPHVAAAVEEGPVLVLDLDGDELLRHRPHERRIWSITFSPDGEDLLTTSRDQHARLWSLDGELRTDFGDHLYTVSRGAFSPDGSLVATATTDGRIRLWTASGRMLTELRAHRGQVWGLAFTADGEELVSGSYDRTVRTWPVAVERLLRLARSL